jgi:hypothetical protein
MVQGLISIDDIHAIGFCDSDSDFMVQSCDSNSDFLFQSCEAGLTVTGIIDGDRSIQTSDVGGLLPFPLYLGNIPMTKVAMRSHFFEETKSSTDILVIICAQVSTIYKPRPKTIFHQVNYLI